MTQFPSTSLILSSHDFDAFTDPFVLLDRTWRVVFANEAASRLRGSAAGELVGLPFHTAFSVSPNTDLDVVAHRVMTTRVPETFETYYATVDVWAQGMVFPFQDGLGVLYQDVTAKKRAEARQETLYRVTSELSRAITKADVVNVILSQAVPAARATSGAVGVLSDDAETVRLLGTRNYSTELQARLAEFPVALDIPGAFVVRTGEAVFGDTRALEARFSAFRSIRPSGLTSMAVLPLEASNAHFGFLALVYEGDERQFDEGERQFLSALAGQCAQALERARQSRRALEEGQARRASEAALAEERAYLAAILEHLPVGVVIAESPSARITLGNARVEEIFGHPVHLSQSVDEYRVWKGYHLDGRPVQPHEWPLARVATSGETTVGEELVYVRPDGTTRVIDVTSAPVKDEAGTPIAAVVVIDDVTERKAAERAVRDLNANLEALVEARTAELAERTRSLEAFVDFAEAAGTASDVRTLARQALGVFRTFFNECSAAYYERDGQMWRAQVWTQDIAPEVVASITGGIPVDAPAFWQASSSKQPVFVDGWDPEREQVAATEAYGTVALYPLTVGGEVRAMLAVGLKDARQWRERDKAVVRAAGRSLNLAVERADAAARLEAQRAALENRTRVLEAFGELTRDLTVNADPVALIRRAQEIVLSLLPEGFAPYYVRDGQVWRLVVQVGERRNPEMQRIVNAGLPFESQSLRRPYETGEPYYQDAYNYQEDHFRIDWAQIGAVASLPVRVAGQVHGVFAVALFGQRGWTDADRALMETVARSLGLALEAALSTSTLQQRTLELERSNKELERFAYIASHDLQEPLRTVASYTDLLALRYGGQLDARAEKYLTYIKQGSLRMRSLIQDLLSYSRLSTNDAPTSTNANVALEDARDLLSGLLSASGARLSSQALPSVRVGRARLTQLFQNLIGNAVKFRRDGVTPTVHVGVAREVVAREEPWWHFTVSDNGIGIETPYLERIFDVFQRLHTREAYEGNGIGLSICQKIVEQAGGRLWVESVPGEGSTFHFTLPGVEDGA
ncbi:GAF domain-containing protein [Deinococcus yavapaiensis]|uniref:histidine kinase n=1 Tax=Deinococcus yavapaiensis KR-236 TaxID=694435 RepID=A0A318S8J9_9DEIO|nr:GAF domain-containing protein [Deinococcus yavapaiensis]PYE52726.1 PAS domain S-box-containing protein [Deinococcus yavapaiensis KR-236]